MSVAETGTTDTGTTDTGATDTRQGAAVQVRAFAAARAALGWSEQTVTVDAPVTVGALLGRLVDDAPAAAEVLARCAVLVDGVRTGAGVVVRAGATVDLLPPFAGG
jgi:molybdopterin converting factor small subunit